MVIKICVDTVKLSKVYTELSTGMHKLVQVNPFFKNTLCLFGREAPYDRLYSRSI